LLFVRGIWQQMTKANFGRGKVVTETLARFDAKQNG